MKNTKSNLKNMENVNIDFFLERLCGIRHSNNKNMTHKDMDELFPKIKRTSYAHVLKNPALLHAGSIVLVKDARFDLAPYFVPSMPIPIPETREQMITSFIPIFQIVREYEEEALLIIENNRVLDKHMTEHRLVCSSEDKQELATSLINEAKGKRGLICSSAGNVYSYVDLIINGKKENYETLEEQALMITSLSDASAFLIESDLDISFVVGGKKYEDVSSDNFWRILNTAATAEETNNAAIDRKSYALNIMTLYELEKLMAHYKTSKEMAYYHTVRKEIKSRTKSTKEHKAEKTKQLIRDRGLDYEEY